jgi:RHS repeat-associated protein
MNRLATETGDPAGSVSYSYDNNGNLASQRQGSTSKTYQYDVRDQMRSVTIGGNQVGSYDYDFMRRRLARSGGGSSLNYVYDGDRVLNEFSAQGTLQNRYDYGADLARGELAGEGVHFYFSDGQSSVTALSVEGDSGSGGSGSPGTPATRYEYDTWGSLIAGGQSANTFGYTGQKLDSESGLQALGDGERYYSSGLGQFQQQDSSGGSLEDPGSLNRHSYVQDNPLRFSDPSGHLTWGQGFSAFGRGFANAVVDPFKEVSDLVCYDLAIFGIGDMQHLEFQGGIAKSYLSYKAQGADTDIAVLSTIRDTALAIGTVGIVPMVEGHINAYNDLKAGKITDDQYKERLWEIAGGATGVAFTASIGSAAMGEGFLGEGAIGGSAADGESALEGSRAPVTETQPLKPSSLGESESGSAASGSGSSGRSVSDYFARAKQIVADTKIKYGIPDGAVNMDQAPTSSEVISGPTEPAATVADDLGAARPASDGVASDATDVSDSLGSEGKGPSGRSDAELQHATDRIHEAQYGDDAYAASRNPMTLTETPGGRLVLSRVKGIPGPAARAMTDEIFGEGNVEFVEGGERANAPGAKGHHSEARGIQRVGDEAAGGRQASSHYACPTCEVRQGEAGIRNITGTKSQAGRQGREYGVWWRNGKESPVDPF